MTEYGGQYPSPNQPWSGPPAGQPVNGPYYPQQVSGPGYPVSGPHYPTSSGAVVPAGAMVPAGAEHPLCAIGEIAVTTTMVHTPMGSCPLRGSQWAVQDQWIATQKTPTWAIVLSIVGFCVVTIFSLLFLLAKETVVNGVVMVTVSNGHFTYSARVPVHDQMMAHHLHSQVNYVRAMAMR